MGVSDGACPVSSCARQFRDNRGKGVQRVDADADVRDAPALASLDQVVDDLFDGAGERVR